MALTDKLTTIADKIRSKYGTTEGLTLDNIVEEIDDLVPENAFEVTGLCNYRFFNGYNDWFLTNCRKQMSTHDVTNCAYMFAASKVDKIPFEINLAEDTEVNTEYMFYKSKIEELPYINGTIKTPLHMFDEAKRLHIIPDDWGDRIDWTTVQSDGKNMRYNFRNCYTLRKIPESILNNFYTTESISDYYNCPLYNSFYYCIALDEIKGLGVFPTYSYSYSGYNPLANFLVKCGRLKSFTFATEEDGTPKEVNWTNLDLKLTEIGRVIPYYYSAALDLSEDDENNYLLAYSDIHGITAEKRVTDAESYERLKNDPDWYTIDYAYSRYNHDSAVETINSLPKTSGSGCAIYFKQGAGSATDGGAVDSLTTEEIAIATAKGWTVGFIDNTGNYV